MTPVDQRAARNRQRDDLLGAVHRVHEIEPIDAVVVLGLRLDVHFLEPRHRTVRRRLENAHVGRPIVQRPDEVLGLAAVAHALAIGQRDPVGIVVDDLQRRGQLGRRVGCQRETLAVAERHLAGGRRTIGEHAHANVGAWRRIDIAAIAFGPRRQPQTRRIGVFDVDALDARRVRDGHVVDRRRQRPGGDPVLERGRDGVDAEPERTRRVGGHLRPAPPIAVGHLHLRDDRRAIADQPRANRQRRTGLDPCVARRHFQHDPGRKERERRRVERLTRRTARRPQHGGEHEH